MTSSEPAKRDYPKNGRKPEKRAWALKQARQVIVTSQGIASTREISAVDLVSLAEYILTGEDPWASAVPAKHEVTVNLAGHCHREAAD